MATCVYRGERERETEREGEHARNGNGRFAVGRIVGGKRTRTQTLATTRTNTRSITRLCRLSTDTQQRTHPLAGVLFALRLWGLSLPLSGFWGFRVVRRCVWPQPNVTRTNTRVQLIGDHFRRSLEIHFAGVLVVCYLLPVMRT